MNKENCKEEIHKKLAPLGVYNCQEEEGIVDEIISEYLLKSHQQGRMEMAEEIRETISKMRKDFRSDWTEQYLLEGDIDPASDDYNKAIQEIINNLKTNIPTTEVER